MFEVAREQKAPTPGWVLQGQLTYAQVSAFGRPAAFGQSMSLVPGDVCSYDRGCDHEHGVDPFGPAFEEYRTVHDFEMESWTVQDIRKTPVPDSVPVMCIYCTFTGDISQHVCGTRTYIALPSTT